MADAGVAADIYCYCAKSNPLKVYSNKPDGMFGLCKTYFLDKLVNLFM